MDLEFTFSGEIQLQRKGDQPAQAQSPSDEQVETPTLQTRPLANYASFSEKEWERLEEEMSACFGTDVEIVHVPEAALQWLPWPPKPPHFDEPFRKHLDHRFPREDDQVVRALIDSTMETLKSQKDQKEENDRRLVRKFAAWQIIVWVAVNAVIWNIERIVATLESETAQFARSTETTSTFGEIWRLIFAELTEGGFSVSLAVLIVLLSVSQLFVWPLVRETRERLRGLSNQALSDTLAKFGARMQKIMEELSALYHSIEYDINKTTNRTDSTNEAKRESLENAMRYSKLIALVERKALYYEERLEASIWAYYRWEHRDAIRRFWREVRRFIYFAGLFAAFLFADLATERFPSFVGLSGVLLLVLAFVRFFANTERLRLHGPNYSLPERAFWDRMNVEHWTRASKFRLHEMFAKIVGEQVKDIHKFEDLRR